MGVCDMQPHLQTVSVAVVSSCLLRGCFRKVSSVVMANRKIQGSQSCCDQSGLFSGNLRRSQTSTTEQTLLKQPRLCFATGLHEFERISMVWKFEASCALWTSVCLRPSFRRARKPTRRERHQKSPFAIVCFLKATQIIRTANQMFLHCQVHKRSAHFFCTKMRFFRERERYIF